MLLKLGASVLLDARTWLAAAAFALPLPIATLGVADEDEVPTTEEVVISSWMVTVPYKTILKDDDSIPVDVEVEKTEGSDGKVYNYVVEKKDGSRVVEQKVIAEPVDRVIHQGTAFELPTAEEPPEPEPEPEEETNTNQGGETSRGDIQEAPAPTQAPSSDIYSVNDMMFQGVINWNGYKFTYYSQSVLPGPGLAIPGRHVNSGGFVSDGDGYIVLAAPRGVAHGTVFSTPFGYDGKIYDTCASCTTSPMWLDVYTR